MLAVVVPAFNETGRIGISVAMVLSKFPDVFVVVVDDGSFDGTAEEARAAGAAVVQFSENRGKGAAVREGVLEALGAECNPILFTDCDLACPPEEWERVLLPVEKGSADVSIASRWLPGSRVEGRTLSRTLASWGFGFLARLLMGLPYRDFQCGCKAFTADAARALFVEPLRCEKFAFDVEILLRARDFGLTVTEVPVLWRAGRTSQVRLLRHSSEMLESLLVLRGIYGGNGGREDNSVCLGFRPERGAAGVRRPGSP